MNSSSVTCRRVGACDSCPSWALARQGGVGPARRKKADAVGDPVDIGVDGDDVLVRLRVENHRDAYLDLGVQGTIYGPLLVMIDDRGQRYEGYAEEPAGIPGRRLADLSFRLEGPIDRGAESFTLERATQRGTVTSPSAALPAGDGVRWRVDDPVAGAPASAGSDPSEPGFAAAPRLPELIHFWLHTEPLSAAG